MADRKKEYDFPNARLVVSGRKCFEFPKWCPMIHVERSRSYVASALLQLRSHRRSIKEKVLAVKRKVD